MLDVIIKQPCQESGIILTCLFATTALFHVNIPLNSRGKHWEWYLNFWKEKKEEDLIQQWQIKLAKNAEPPKPANTHIHTIQRELQGMKP